MNILIVDDEIVTTQVLEEKLDRERLKIERVYVAYDAAMAREILKNKSIRIDMVLCDIEMPQENGIHLLEWVRKQKIKVEFVFLTSHEKFEYAYGAVQNGAANYLLKPIDMDQINQALFRVMEKIIREKRIKSIQDYWNYGQRKLMRYFWTELLLKPCMNGNEIEKEIKNLGIAKNIYEKYCFILLHCVGKALGFNGENRTVNLFIVENILAEAFTENIKMEHIVCWEKGETSYIGIMSEYLMAESEEKLKRILGILENYFPGAFRVAYISDYIPFTEIGRWKQEMESYDQKHIYDEGEIWIFSELKKRDDISETTLDHNYLIQCIDKRERVKTMEYLQKILKNVKKTTHSTSGLRYFQLELLRIINSYFQQQSLGIDIILSDPIYLRLDEAAISSEFAMVQWFTYLMNKIFSMTEEKKVKEDRSLTEQIIDYIRMHYTEEINRNTLAEEFHFTAGYIGRLFRKDMGMTLNDYINLMRVKKAEHLLLNTENKIIDVALEVGYDNFTYFSSVFKKYNGECPAEYRKNRRKN